MSKTISVHNMFFSPCSKLGIFMHWTCNSINNLSSYCSKLMQKWDFLTKIYLYQSTNISSIVEFQKWWVLKGNIFDQESTYFFKIRQWNTVHQKVPKSYFQCQFSMSKINRIFSKKKSFKNSINLGYNFLLKIFFSRLNFWTTLLAKIMANFWWTDIPRRNFLIFLHDRYNLNLK